MSIERRRKERAIAAIVEDRIREGYHPSFGEVVGEMAVWATKEKPERPYARKQWVYAGDVVERSTFVDFFENALHDILDLRAEAIEQTHRQLALFEKNRIERERVQEKGKRVERKLRQAILASRAGLGTQIEVLRVHGESQWKEGDSDTLVDAGEGVIRLNEVTELSEPIRLAGRDAIVRALRGVNRSVSLSDPDNMTDGNLNTAWWHVIKTEDPGNGESRVSLEVTFPFGKQSKLNMIKLFTIDGEKTAALIETSNDGSSFSTVPGMPDPVELKGDDVFRFIETEASFLRLTLSKSRHDEFSAGSYNYYFAIQDIYASGTRYVTKGTAFSEPVLLRDGVHKIAIETTSMEPSSTSLTYMVAQADMLKKPIDWAWIPISPAGGKDRRFEQVVSISQEKEHVAEFDRIEKSGEVLFGQDVHTLTRSDGRIQEIGGKGTEKNELRLYRGIGQWKVERKAKPFNGDAPMRSDFAGAARTRFIPFGNTLYLDRGKSSEENLFRFTATLFVDHDREQPISVGVTYEDGGYKTRVASYSIYVNEKRLTFESDRYRLPLKKGWNIIELLFHVGDMSGRVEFDEEEFPTELYIGQWDTVNERMVRGEVAGLKAMTKNALYQEVANGDEAAFAMEGGKVYVMENDHDALYQLIYSEKNDAPVEVAVRVDFERGDDLGATPTLSEVIIKGSVE
ncbi:hypothetical protein C0431_12325 [bacterium]|nr:hypothetical protein [bacterium]